MSTARQIYTIQVTNINRLDGSTHSCKTEQCAGGVARNMAEALWRLRNGRTRLLTAIGEDDDGRYLKNIAPGLILDGCTIKNGRTAKYAAIFDAKGECNLGLGDMDIHSHISIDLINRHIEVLKKSPLVVIDGNISTNVMDYLLELCNEYQKPVFFEPTDKRKAVKALSSYRKIAYASPNYMELKAMANFLQPNITINPNDKLHEIIELSKIVLKSINCLIVTRGSQGVITIKNSSECDNNQIEVRIYSTETIFSVENVSGAGDCFSSGFVYGLVQGLTESQSINIGFKTAKKALLSKNTVPSYFSILNNFDEAKYSVLNAENFSLID